MFGLPIPGFGDSGGSSFSGGGIGSSANETTTTTDNKNNATSGDNSAIFDSKGGAITLTDGGAIDKVFQFARDTLGYARETTGSQLAISESERTGGANRTLWLAAIAIAAIAFLGKR